MEARGKAYVCSGQTGFVKPPPHHGLHLRAPNLLCAVDVDHIVLYSISLSR